jgi:drug/metabolite transporter (DMT)-like permease
MVLYLRGEHLVATVLAGVDPSGWALVMMIALVSMFQKACYFLAYRFETAAGLQKLAYVSGLLTVLMDVQVFGHSLGTWEVIGFIGCLLAMSASFYINSKQ